MNDAKTYDGDHKSAIARAKRALLRAGIAWSRITGRYSPYGGNQTVTPGVKVTRVGYSRAVALQVVGLDGRVERQELEQRALAVLRADGLEFDARGFLYCRS